MQRLWAVALVAMIAAPVAGQDSLTGTGISAELARYRSARVRDVRYDLRLDVTERDTARGQVTVRFRRMGSGDAILDFRGPSLGAALLNGRALAPAAWNGAHLRVPAVLLRAGMNTLQLQFKALIAPSAASVIRFHDGTDGADYLYTLLVPADANQLFPCFDQPDLKAKVSLALTIRKGWTAVANGALAARDSSAGGVTLRFAETPPLSTYLIAFAAGPWATVRRTALGRPITMYVRTSRAAEAEADSLIDQNARAAEWLERYFAVPFPFPKLDFVLAPAFPFGGMEHPGAIFYNEDRFVFRERATQVQRIGRANTIYHEVAHQWFGDLVTMRWFDDLWLKEGFSTYMAAKMQDALEPSSGAWKTFYLRNKPAAYEVDVTAGTTPVWQALANLDQAKSNYGAIVYNKAPGVLKQLNSLVGDDAFRRGVTRFLRAHAYGNATWRDLLRAIGTEAGTPLDTWGEQYILRPGMPVIEGGIREVAEGLPRVPIIPGRDHVVTTIELHQRPADSELSGPEPWPIRTRVLVWYDDSRADTIAASLQRATTRLSTPVADRRPAFVFANAGDDAYALTLIDPGSVAWLEEHVAQVRDDFLRAMLWGSLWDLVRAARLEPARYVALAIRELPRERDEQIASSVLGRTVRATRAYLSSAARDSLLPRLEFTLRAVAEDSTRPYGIRKAHLDALIAAASTPATLGMLDSLLDQPRAAGEPLRPPTRWAIVTALIARSATNAEARLAAEQRRDTTSDGQRRAFIAGAARPDPMTKRRYFERYFADTTLNEDWATASLGAFNTIDHQALTLPYLAPALDSLPWIQRNRRIFYVGSWLDAFLGGQTSPEALRAVNDFLARHPALPADLRRKVLQAGDELRRTVAMREKYGI